MAKRVKFRVRCLTEDDWVSTGFINSGSVPTECPNHSSHSIADTLTTIIEEEVIDTSDSITGDHYMVSDDVQSTTSTTYQNKLTFTALDLEEGNYKINFYAESGSSSTKTGVEIQCTVGGVEIGYNGYIPKNKDYEYMSFSGFGILNLSGDVEIKINWRRGDKSGTVKCRNARVEIIRVI